MEGSLKLIQLAPTYLDYLRDSLFLNETQSTALTCISHLLRRQLTVWQSYGVIRGFPFEFDLETQIDLFCGSGPEIAPPHVVIELIDPSPFHFSSDWKTVMLLLSVPSQLQVMIYSLPISSDIKQRLHCIARTLTQLNHTLNPFATFAQQTLIPLQRSIVHRLTSTLDTDSLYLSLAVNFLRVVQRVNHPSSCVDRILEIVNLQNNNNNLFLR